MANVYLYEVWKHFRLPKYITSDQGLQFALAFTKGLNKKLDIGLQLSTGYHP